MPSLPVLLIHRKPGAPVRFIDQVIGEGVPEIDFRFGRAQLDDADLQVVHLPRFASLFGPDVPPGPQRVKRVWTIGTDLRRRKVALVRTLGEADSRAGHWDRLAQRLLERFTTSYVALDDSVRAPRGATVTVIPHAHYRERFSGYPRSETVAGRVAWLGPAGLDLSESDVLAASAVPHIRFLGTARRGASDQITQAAQARPDSISARIERLSDGAWVAEITAAALVVLPSVHEPEELNAVHLALSLGRPVLVPNSPAMQSLQRQVGAEWVHLTPTAPDGAALSEALAHLPAAGATPDLPGEDLVATSARYADVFRAAAAAVR